ncbi:DUF4177 domain-containing protein [Sphingorhabdus sp.]|jgi:hypothetical protein|uniref:DUF4177 domain-containing protein n=1 Tax=Sphingorhabdus sp. TaxID=1902408 RepID=UPI003D81B82C
MQWEYKIIEMDMSFKPGDPKPHLDREGSGGWELVSVIKQGPFRGDTQVSLFFKRPVTRK